ncbi:MAG: DUF3662 domain-containing protein [Chloroflexi bacterium]|uniref:DUF3662 domain-containing protein n=1 Tax=Candidatus Chlorohelix allophototropha TaxID=3003348 RepID=A0A8T7M573_9CHLR|nr:DUF3662 domain-containing protein [Chloroflexota bacterium]WJW69188.1 DUF3662 domain-containing protein [Chloroflexota bacterium L227-S17]
MGVISKLEGMMETVVEGSFSRLFRNKLHPADISKRLERVMEDTKEVALGKSYVPNRYEVYISQYDFDQFAPYKSSIEKDMAEHVVRYGQQRHFIFSGGSPRVWLNSSEQVKKSRYLIKAYTLDPNQPQPKAANTANGINQNQLLEGTAILNIGALNAEQRNAAGSIAFDRPQATLTVMGYRTDNPDRHFVFKRDVTIGRGLDNDIILENDPRISRHHARIEFKYGQFLLTDLNSANGTSLNGLPVTQIVLTPGDKVSLGGLELIFGVE